jgi:hypothetical protein
MKYKKKYSIYNQGHYMPTFGSFAIGQKKGRNYLTIGYWYNCREAFANVFTSKTKYIVFYHRKNAGQRITKFINRIEKQVKVWPRSEITGIKNRPGSQISVMKVSRWWTKNPARKSLLTILLRCGENYKWNNFEKALKSNLYIRKTKKAVDKFLQGHTRWVGFFAGWFDQFNSYSDEDSIEKLVK